MRRDTIGFMTTAMLVFNFILIFSIIIGTISGGIYIANHGLKPTIERIWNGDDR